MLWEVCVVIPPCCLLTALQDQARAAADFPQEGHGMESFVLALKIVWLLVPTDYVLLQSL